MKTEILKHWRGKIGYCFTFKDLDEIRQLIDYYEKENQKYKEVFNKIKARQEKFRDYLKNTLISVDEELINKTYGEDCIEWLLHRRTSFDDVLKKYDLIMKGVNWKNEHK